MEMTFLTLTYIFIFQKEKFHRPHTLSYNNGYAMPKTPVVGIGGTPIGKSEGREKAVFTQLRSLDNIDSTSPEKNKSTPSDQELEICESPEFIPKYVSMDKKVCLDFNV